jgi:hypothetical protein
MFSKGQTEDSLVLKQNWPFMAKRTRNASTIRTFGDVRPFTVTQNLGECSGYDEDMLRDERPRKHGSIRSRNFLFTKTSIMTPGACITSQLTGNRRYISQYIKLTTQFYLLPRSTTIHAAVFSLQCAFM